MPKAEVHVHLEGCFDVEDIVQLADHAGEPLPRPPDRLFEWDSMDDFLRFLDWKTSLVRTPDQASEAAFRFAARETMSGVGYADVIINPTHWGAWSTRLGDLVDALDLGFGEAERQGLAAVGLCLSLSRNQSEEEALALVDWMLARDHPRIVALSVDGNEAVTGRTGPKFAEAFRRAGAGGLKRTAHAGESSGPEGVRDAVELLEVERIDHGTRAIEDPSVVQLLVDREVPLAICPSSNLIRRYPDMASHPLERLRQAGVAVCVNTDDPADIKTNLEKEYSMCIEAYGWGLEDAKGVARMSIEASFAPETAKAGLLAELADWEPDPGEV